LLGFYLKNKGKIFFIETCIIFLINIDHVIYIYIYIYACTEFPGSKPVSEASSKYGPALVPGPVLFVFEKVSTFIVTEEKVDQAPEAAKTTEEEASGKEKEIVAAEEEKKEEEVLEKIEVAAEAEKAEPAYTTEPPHVKVEEAEPPKP
jgi:hypothetical protein